MIAVSRFTDVDADLAAGLRRVADFWATRAGCVDVDLVQNLDDPGLWALISRWENVGAYRRAFNGYDAKLLLTPVLSRAVDEPSAYLPPEDLGANVPRSS